MCKVGENVFVVIYVENVVVFFWSNLSREIRGERRSVFVGI